MFNNRNSNHFLDDDFLLIRNFNHLAYLDVSEFSDISNDRDIFV